MPCYPISPDTHFHRKAIAHPAFTSIEVKLRKALWNRGYRYRKNYGSLPGKPDIALTKYKIAIFCDSDYPPLPFLILHSYFEYCFFNHPYTLINILLNILPPKTNNRPPIRK